MKPVKNSIKLLLALSGAFAAGWAGGGGLFATSVNSGLVNALNSVGQNLFGSAVFRAVQPADPVLPSDPIRVFFADNSRIPLAFNVFAPPDPITPTNPCRSYLQVSVDPVAGVVVKYDPAAVPAGFSTDMQPVTLAAEKPNTAQCPASVD